MIRWCDVFAAWLIVTSFLGLAEYRAGSRERSSWFNLDRRWELGSEYDEIAKALRNGRGFADPFREPSGPTSWMPPVLPCLLAALYWTTGDDRTLVIEVVYGLQALVILFTAVLFLAQARRLGRVAWGYAILVGALAANFFLLFQLTHDVWLVLLVVNLLWLGLNVWWDAPSSLGVAAGWGAFGGFAALCNPIVGAAWAAATAWRWRPRRLSRPVRVGTAGDTVRPLLLAALVSVVVVTPWTIRNRLVLGAWIPIKSNGMYEVWQSECLDDDGVIDSESISQHPFPSAGEQRRRYLEVGEIQFIAERAALARQSIRADPLGFLSRVARRGVAASVYYRPFSYWFDRLVWPKWFKRCVFPLPLIGLACVLVFRCRPLEREIVAAIAIYFLVLLPYVAISYHDRYAVTLLGIKMMLVLYGVDSVLARWRLRGK